jgi:hypothetical protein
MELESTDTNGVKRQIIIKYVKQLQFGDFQYTQVLNIFARKMIQMLGLQQVGRNFYDPQAMVHIKFIFKKLQLGLKIL